MIKQFFKIGGVKNEKDFLAKYPTEESFFRQHPEAMSLMEQSTPFMPSYSDVVMPQAMYGMGMAYGGYVPYAANGMEVTDPPKQQDYPDHESYAQAFDNYLASMQQQADAGQVAPQGTINTAPTSMTGAPVVAPSSSMPNNKFNLKDYSGYSIVDFLMTQGKPADFSSRKELASILGITNYRGTASQNKQMIKMLQQNPDVLTNYDGVEQPTGGVRKAVATSKNAKGAPSTQSIAQAKQAALAAPSYGNPFTMPDKSKDVVRRDFNTMRWVHVPDPAGMMTVENARRVKMADDLNRAEAAEASGQPMFKQGYARGGAYTGTWSGNQGFAVGGSYLPDYAGSAYGLPQFELGAPIYADGGMSPEEAMMMQQQGASAPPPQQGGGMDQQQIIQAIVQMIQQGMDPNQIMQQLAQNGVPPELAQQLVMMVMQQVQGGGGAPGGQGGMGGGQPNGMQQPMAPPSPEQGMEGMQMPGGMARGGMVRGWEGEVTMQQLEELRKKGVKFDII